jgi:scyllo-inosamine 4-kinase
MASATTRSSFTNVVWLFPDVVLRVAAVPSSRTLVTEASLLPLLPAQVGAPDLLDAGEAEGRCYLLVRRIPGVDLQTAWPTLSVAQRQVAIHQTAEILRGVRSVPVHEATAAGVPGKWGAIDEDEVLGTLDRLVQRKELDGLVASAARVLADEYRSARVNAPPQAVCHLDAHLGNFLWHDERVSGLLDFESACVAPADVELDQVLRTYGDPAWYTSDRTDDPATRELLPSVIEEHADLLSLPGSYERLCWYALAYDTWIVRSDIDRHPDGLPPGLHGVERMKALLAGSGYHANVLKARLATNAQ